MVHATILKIIKNRACVRGGWKFSFYCTARQQTFPESQLLEALASQPLPTFERICGFIAHAQRESADKYFLHITFKGAGGCGV